MFTESEKEMVMDALAMLEDTADADYWYGGRTSTYEMLVDKLHEAGWSGTADVPDEYQNICSVSTKEF